jgi:hypothetical protein
MHCSGINLRALSSGVLQSAPDGGTYVNSTGTISFNIWTHVAVVRQATSNAVEFFINGNSAGTATQGTITNTNENTWGNVNANFAYGRGFDGFQDDLRVYDRAVTMQEIRTMATRRNIAYERRATSYLAQIVAALRNRRTSSRMLTFPG